MPAFKHVEAPLRIYSGVDSLEFLGRELGHLNSTRAVVFCGRTIGGSPLLDLIRNAMGSRCAGIFTGVCAHAPRTSITEATEQLLRLSADAVVAIGGGSAAVSARAASILLAEGGDLEDLATSRGADGRMQSPRLHAAKIPQIVIPTTPNTAMVKAGTAVFDAQKGRRLAMFDPKARSHAIFLHPDFLMSSPRDLVITAGLNSLSLAIEGLTSRNSGDPMSDAALMHALRLLVDGLQRLMVDDTPDLRADLTMGAVLCGRGTDHTGAGVATVLGHAIGSNFHVDSGIVKSVVMPVVLRFNAAYTKAGLTKIVTALRLPTSKPPDQAISAMLTSTYRALHLPERLRDLGIDRNGFAAIAERCLLDWFLKDNPRAVTTADLIGILAESW